MKRVTMEKILKSKFNKWVASITDKEVREAVQENTYITGGAITSMLLNEDINDYDAYFKDYHTTLLVAKYYTDKYAGESIFVEYLHDERVSVIVPSAGVADVKYDRSDTSAEEDTSFTPVFFSQNAITLSDDIQLILRFFGDIDTIHENYDYVHATNYWDSATGKVTLRLEALEHTLSKTLVYRGSKYPLASIVRSRKFIQRGWSINAGQYLVMVMQLNELDLTNIEVLHDQLQGVDSAYFSKMFASIKANDGNISATYIAQLVERIFK